MDAMRPFEQFSTEELATLREELQLGGLDTFQCGAVVSNFLTNKGYGVSSDRARAALTRMEPAQFTLLRLQEELEKLAYVM